LHSAPQTTVATQLQAPSAHLLLDRRQPHPDCGHRPKIGFDIEIDLETGIAGTEIGSDASAVYARILAAANSRSGMGVFARCGSGSSGQFRPAG
jgi:hypothetical protein